MRKEQLSNIISYLESIKEKSGEYKDYIENLDLLASRLIDYYTPDIYGKYKNITQEEYDELDNLFKNSIRKADYYLSTGFFEEENVEARDLKKKVNEDLYKDFLVKYYADFKKVDVNSGKTFYEEMEKAKSRESGNISTSKISFDGFFLKDEMTVEYNDSKVTGSFIYDTNYDPDKAVDNLIKEYCVKYPEYKDYFIELNNFDTLNELANIKNDELLSKNAQVVNFFNNKELKVNEIAGFDEYKNQISFLNANADFIMKLRPVMDEIKAYTIDLNIKNGANLDRRNVAVSGIARMLDAKNEIPEAREVAIEKEENGKKAYIDGTFVESARGKTIKEFDIKDPIHASKMEDWDTVEAKKSLANLQIIDYICGNKNRKLDDIKFEFDPKTNKLIGVQGINNQKSFYHPDKPDPEIIGEEDYSELKDIKVIDEAMATKVMAYEKATFKAMLATYGLSREEADACWTRVERLQELIKKQEIIDEKDKVNEALENGKLVVVSSEAWMNVKLDDLALGDNIFTKTIEAKDSLVNEAKVDKNLVDRYNVMKFTLNNKLLKGDDFVAEARKNAPLFGTSKRYSNVLKALNDYRGTVDLEQKAEKLIQLNKCVDTYLGEKVNDKILDEDGTLLKNLSGKDLGRINLVKNLKEFVNNTLNLQKEADEAKALKEKNEKDVDELNATFRLGKYQNYAKLFKNDEGKILINSNILEREKQNNIILSKVAKQMVELNNGNSLEKDPAKKEQYEVLKNYISTTVENCKEQLKNDYHHGTIPKEYFDFKNERLDKKMFGFEEEEKMFASENPESKIFKNPFQEELNKEFEDLEKNGQELQDMSSNDLEKADDMEDLDLGNLFKEQ